MPAATASRRSWYSAAETCGTVRGRTAAVRALRLVGGKLPHRLSDLLRTGHEELLTWSVERHCRNVRRRDAGHWSVEVLEGVLRDDRGDLGPKAAGEVVFVNDHRLAGFA